MNVYVYDGPVLQFNQLIMEHWTGETTAPSEAKAKSNLTYQFKKQYNRLPSAKITLPGKLKVIN